MHLWYVSQEIAAASGHDKKTAKKEAAKIAIQFLLQYNPVASTAPAHQPSQQQAAAQPSASDSGIAVLSRCGSPSSRIDHAVMQNTAWLSVLITQVYKFD